MPNRISSTVSCFALIVLMLVASAARAQVSPTANNVEPGAQRSNPTVTARATSDRVRFTSPNTVVQLRLEVYDEAGQKVLDTEQRGGNVIDWHLQGGAGERVADGVYLCVLTSKNLSGRFSQKLGRVTVSGQSNAVQPAAIAELNPRQAQTVGPVEAGAAGLTVMGAEDAPPVTVLANNGNDAQLARTRGALTFRVGDFFSGNDKEQMRLSEEGNLGIGTTKPKAKLDVAGLIRAREGFMFSDGSTLKVNEKGVLTRTNADGTAPSTVTTTQDKIAKFTDNAGTVGDSVITESAGNIGIGTTPVAKLDVAGDINTTTKYNLGGNRVLSGTGSANFFAGVGAGQNNSTGVNNSFFGFDAGMSNTGGFNNSFFGNSAGAFNTSNNNSFFGDYAGRQTQTGSFNSFFGESAGTSNSSGCCNAFFGGGAGQYNTFGNSNTFIGAVSGLSNTVESNNTFIGYQANGAFGVTNATAIGANAVVSQSNSLVLGSGVNVGIGTTTPAQSLEVANGRILTSGIQTLAVAGGMLEIGTTLTNNNNQASGIRMRNLFNGNASIQQALDVAPTFAPSASISLARGFLSSAFFAPPSGVTITDAYGGNAGMVYSATSGVVTNGTAFAIRSPIVQGSLKPTTQYGLHILNQGIAGTSNTYGLFVDAQSGSTNNYSAIFADGNVGIGITVPVFKLQVIDSSNTGLRVQTDISGGTVASFGGFGDFKIDAPGTSGGRLIVKENSNVGIGTNSPNARLQVAGGNIYVPNPNSLIITSPNGTCWFITVANSGALSTIPVPCP